MLACILRLEFGTTLSLFFLPDEPPFKIVIELALHGLPFSVLERRSGECRVPQSNRCRSPREAAADPGRWAASGYHLSDGLWNIHWGTKQQLKTTKREFMIFIINCLYIYIYLIQLRRPVWGFNNTISGKMAVWAFSFAGLQKAAKCTGLSCKNCKKLQRSKMISLNMFDAFCWGHQRQYESLWGSMKGTVRNH